jgi:predicted ATPase/signal transduction histidine kinase/GAF domain-containing protein
VPQFSLSGYALSPLRKGDPGLFRGSGNGLPPILLVTAEDDSIGSLKRLEHEHELKAELNSAWAARPIALSHQNGRMALLCEDPGGEPLDRMLRGPLKVTEFLRIAIPLAGAVRRMHEQGLIHKDMKPANVLVDPATGGVWLTGFGIASRLPRERQNPEPPEVIAGTLAYMAPEQTGRMNRSIDSRSDLYALGVAFYEMLTGTLPFNASDPMEWIHCHVARQPVPPSQRMAAIPVQLSMIVMKLLAKIGEERYQTAAGVEADLRRCLNDWESSGRIELFPPGAQDASDRLMIPERLYGREREIETLLAAFDRVVSRGTTELVLVSGYSGIGKSSVVNELHKVLVPPRGLFAAGKFDQYKRDIPYLTLAQAFQSLVRELLSKSDVEIDEWRGALMEALGPNGELIVKLIPELALIIGDPPPVPSLPPRDAQNRFQLVFRRFLGVFARPEHPLALFVDDLQWLDTATLDLIEHLVTHPEVKHLLLVGAFRDNEVGPSHPLMRTLGQIRDSGGRVQETVLAPLAPASVGQLIADSFQCDMERARPLAQLVHEKTGGNPFFVIQFLMALSEESLLTFDHGAAAWIWDMPRIRAKGFTTNVADLMAAKLNRLADTTRDALGQLACLGNIAEIATLTLLHGEVEEKIHERLWEAVRAGLVYRADGVYTFVHDRVQEAAYGLIPEGDRPAAHLRIGRVLASRRGLEELEETIFDTVNHLNRGAALITMQEERERVVELNLMAGQRARNSTAYASARNYLAHAAALLSPDAWTRRYEETFELHLALSECEYLVGNFIEADALSDLALDRARSNLDRAKVYSLRIKLYQVAGQYDDGCAAALDGLREFGVTFPESDEDIRVAMDAEFRDIPNHLGDRRIAELLEAPLAASPATRAIIDLLVELMPCAYIGRPQLWPLITLKAVNLSMRDGNTAESSFVYGNYATMLISLGDIPSAIEFSEMALRLNEKLNNPRLRGRLLHVHADHHNFWRRHIATDIPILEQALRACLEVGDHVFAGYITFETLWQLIEKGDALQNIQTLSIQYAAFAGQSHNDAVCQTIRLEQHFVASLQGRTKDLATLDNETFSEVNCLAALVKANFGCGIVFYHIMKQMLAFLDRRFEEAHDCAMQAAPLIGAVVAMPIEATYHFLNALTLTALYPTAPASQQQDYLRVLKKELLRLELWAHNCPENYQNRYALISAEVARIEGRDVDAMRLYEEAIRSSREHGFIQNQGIAHELAAQFYAARGFDTIADTYLRHARQCYLRWGAAGKVRQLEQHYPHLREGTAHPGLDVTIETPQEHLDLATVIKTSLAVSSEIVPEKLIETLMVLAIEHAGAERGLLVRSQDDEQRIEAEATTSDDTVTVRLLGRPITTADVPASVLQYVIRTQQSVIMDDATADNRFPGDEYIRQKHVRSLLCLPLVKQARLIAVLYLENNLASHAFTPARIAVLKLLSSQAAISLENARLYAELMSENRDRKRAEAALRRSEASLAQAQQISSTGSWRWKVETGEVISSAELLRLFAYDLAATPPPSHVALMDRTHTEDRPMFERVLDRAVRERCRFQHEYRIALPDGTIKHVQTVGQPEVTDSGEVEFIGTVMDVTERRRAEEALRNAQADLARIARLTTMGELVASIGHELNQPLAAVVTNGSACLRWLDREKPDLEKARQSVAHIVRDAGQAGEVIRGLRALAKKSGPQLTQLELNGAIQEVLALIGGELQRRGVSLRTALAAVDRPIVGDRVQLQQVVLNLILNGVEAMNSVTDRPKVLAISSELIEPGAVQVAVEDTGTGLDPSTADRIFEPFFTTKSDGIGMGLSICRSIIDAHGGRLWATPRNPCGTVFRFTLRETLSRAV